MLRRKGRLKEQDALIDWIIRLHATDGPETVFAKVERWVDEHRARPHGSTLSMHVPVLGSFLTPLPLADALAEYDQFSGLSRRRYVPPNFAEVRHVLNIAQVHALAKLTRGEGESLPLLVTFDADGTLYEDGKHFEADNKMISLLVSLMRRGVQVAIVTAAGYPEAERFEARIRALLAAFEELQLPKETTDRFHMMGGECNYLLAVTDDYRLEFVPNERWQTEEMIGWDESAVEALLDTAQASLESHAARLSMDVDLIRKSRAVGVVPVRPTLYEALEELALSTRYDLESAELDLPFCAFNGGNDVFCDGAMRSPQRGAAVVAWAGCLALTRRLRRARPNAPSPPPPRALAQLATRPSACKHCRRTWVWSGGTRCTSATGSRSRGTTRRCGDFVRSCGWPTQTRRLSSSRRCCGTSRTSLAAATAAAVARRARRRWTREGK